MQLVNLLMKVIIVVLCIHNMQLKPNPSSSKDIFHMPGFIPLVEHIDK
jgi:hypothetical protein